MIDVRREIAAAPLGRHHFLIASLIALIVFFDGYDTFNAAYVIHYVMKPWHLLGGQAGLLVSSGMFGFLSSSLCQGKLSDRYGRRATLLGALWIASLGSLATALLANSFLSFCAARFFTGLGLGVLLPIGVTYMKEWAPARLGNTFATWGWALGFSGGGIMASVVGVFMTPRYGWQALYYVASLSAVLTVICHWALPETLPFLALRGRMREVAQGLAHLNPASASVYLNPVAEFVLTEPSDRIASISFLLSDRYRSTTLAVWAATFFVQFGIYGLTGWVPTAMIQRGETFAVSFSFGALILFMNFAGCLVGSYVADRAIKARWTMFIWWLVGASAMLPMAFANLHWLNVACVAAGGFFILGGQGALNNFTAGWYDTEVRGTAVGMMLGVGRAGAVLGPFVIGVLQQWFASSRVLFPAIAIAVLLGAVAVLSAGAPSGRNHQPQN
jgi:MFS family permease